MPQPRLATTQVLKCRIRITYDRAAFAKTRVLKSRVRQNGGTQEPRSPERGSALWSVRLHYPCGKMPQVLGPAVRCCSYGKYSYDACGA